MALRRRPGDPNVALIPENADLSTVSLAPIAAEMTRLEALFSADKLVRDQYAALTGRIAQENSALQTLEKTAHRRARRCGAPKGPPEGAR